MIEDQRHIDQGENDQNIEGIDLLKLKSITFKSLPFILLIFAISIGVTALTIRYTKQLFESSSVLQIDFKSEAKILGFKSFDEDINNLAREIEIIKSKLFLSKVAEELKIDFSYFKYGDILYEERYRTSPFQIDFFNSISYYNRPIDIEIIDESRFELSYSIGPESDFKESFAFGDTVRTREFSLVASLNDKYDSRIDNKYFFTANTVSNTVKYLDNNLTVEPLDFKAKTITISFKDHNRYKARDIVHAIDTLYLYYTQLQKNQANKQKINFLDEQLDQTEEKLSELEDYFENFTIDNKTNNLDANLSRTIRILEELDSQRYVLEKQILTVNKIHARVMEEEDEDAFDATDISLLSSEIQEDIDQLNLLYQDKEILLNSYNENTFAYQKKAAEIDYLKDRISRYIESQKTSLVNSLAQLKDKREKLEREFVDLPSKRTEYTKTERYYSLYEEFYLSLIKNKAEFELAQAGTVADYLILSPAYTPIDPIAPNKVIYYGVGTVSGFLLSFLFLGIRYLTHNKVTNQAELEKSSSAFVLGSVPFYSLDKNSRFVINRNLKSEISEAFRAIRSNLEFINGPKTKTVISVTSTISGEGKTFITVNLGGIISLLKSRVLLIDLDMRKPRFHEIFSEADLSKGLSTLLIKKHSVDECVQRTSLDNLDYICAGPIPPNPSELILSSAFTELMEELKKQYDVIIIDTPPVGLVTDGIHALKISDIPIYVVRADYSKKAFLKNIDRLIKLSKLSNLSLILNSTKSSEAGKYGYGKGYYHDPDLAKKKSIKKIFHL